MKSLFSLRAIVAGLVALDLGLISAESFTEGVRVSPETVTLKPGQYVWEPERAPEGPLLIRGQRSRAGGVCLSQWYPHRAIERQHGATASPYSH